MDEELKKKIEELKRKLSALDEHTEVQYGRKNTEIMMKIVEQTVKMYQEYFEKLNFELQETVAESVYLLLLELIKNRKGEKI